MDLLIEKVVFPLIIIIGISTGILLGIYFHFQGNNLVEKSIQRAAIFIQNNQNYDGSIALNNDPTLKVWDTATGLLALSISGYADQKTIEKAVSFLKDVKRKDGSYYYTPYSDISQYCTETTSAVIIALKTVGHKEDVKDSLSFLLKKQDSEGFWEFGYKWIPYEERRFPSATGYALAALAIMGYPKDNHVQKGIEYLLETQKNDGSWGKSQVVYQSEYYAIYRNLLALRIYHVHAKESFQKAVKFVRSRQNPNGSWNASCSTLTMEGSTALALNCLLIAGEDPKEYSIQRAVQWLIEHQNDDGSWSGGYYITQPKKKYEDIYVTHLGILALKRYQLALLGEKPPFFIG